MKKYQILLLIALLFITLFVFYPVLNAKFVNLDDVVFVEANWKIASFSFENLRSLLFDSHFKLYHPIVNLSFALEYYLFGNDPYIYHATNLILHLFNTLLVFFIFMLITKKNFNISLITALIFACHPMHVESVAWVSARKDTLYTIFFLASILTYIKAHEAKSKGVLIYSISVILFLFACLSKSMAVTLPAVLIVIDWFMGKKFDKRSILKYIPYFVAAAVFSIITYLNYYIPNEKLLITNYMLFNNFIAAHFNLIFYFVKFIWPAKLAVIYPPFYSPNEILPDFIMFAPAFIYLLVLLIIISLERTKKIFFGFAFFIITILPVINILPTGIARVADRYTYVPYIGLAFIAACTIVFIYKKINIKIFKNAFIVFICAVFALMCISCRSRVNRWQNTSTIFDAQITTYPGEVDQAYAIRALEFQTVGDDKKEERYLLEALRINPDSGLAKISLADLRKKQGRFDEALTLYRQLPYYDINIMNAYANMISIYNIQGEKQKAEKVLNVALKNTEASTYVFIYYNAGVYYESIGDYEKALEYFQLSKKTFPHKHNSYLAIGAIYEKQDKFTLAVQEYIEGIINCGKERDLLFALGNLCSNLDMYERAEGHYLEIIEKFPSDYNAYDALGNIYAITKKYKEAFFCYTMAVLIKNNFGSAYFHRAALYLEMGEFDKAEENAKKALESGYTFPKGFEDDLKSGGIIL